MKRILAGLLALALAVAPAQAASTINTSIPATGAPLQSAPVRGNFVAAATDINNILGLFAGSSAPTSPSVGQDWLSTASAPNVASKWDGTQWVQTATFDRTAHTWTPAIGNSLLAWQELLTGSGGLGTNGQCITSTGASSVPTAQNCVSASTFIAVAPLSWNSGTLTLTWLNLVTAAQTINLNAASLPSALTGTALRVGQADTVIGRVEIDAFGTATPGVLSIVQGRGTGAAPTAVQSGDELGSFNVWGYTGAGTLSGTAVSAFRTYAGENFSSGHQGSKACISTTPTASTTLTDSLCQQPSGGVLIGSPTGGDKGAGTLNATGLFVNNVAVNTSTANVASVTNSDGTLTISPTTGAVVASLALGHVNTWSAAQTFSSGISAGNSTLTGTLTAASLSTVGTIGGSICATSAGLFLYESGVNCFAATASSITVGTTTIASGTSGRVEFNNAGVLGEYSITGTAGSVVMSNAPTIAGETVSGTANFTGTFQFGGNTMTFPGVPASLAALNVADQVVTGGAVVTSLSQSSGNITIDHGARPGQYIVNTGAWTITAPAVTGADGFSVLQVQNGPSAATPGFTGWVVGSNTGDPFVTTVKQSASCTATSASPAVFTYTAHGLLNNWPVYLTGTTAPTGFSLNTQYYVTAKATNTFQLSATPGGAAINSSSTGSTLTCNADSVFNLQMQTIAGLSTYAWKALQ